ncbi:PTS sugar transporter subunit IIB [Leptogranulimonas caecicola]|uniref:PTS sugar transporter subunit IIB n=2 Tax=Coriobacteriales TaxID=84999 RepID=A0A4S2F6U6_9ACTN|nr:MULTISPECIES: PTS sugar transporter subunit IIB [Atopobiaceae]MCI8675337.1 PTS sugar transporter subunit IIB [Atopobiaceae bacterium]TGY63051.1 PTS sugar transporter subunit IIB [Muricaecibacterium torontonense]BCV19557.1 PTS mannitol transporter subunit IIB [Atopobiaceae bacterium P1]BDC90221.1 PTS mannitol transporter subunit IIB [Leptogranulimonas caecicola]
MAIKKIMCACGSGLGSSLMVQMNIDDVLRDLGKTDVSVDHTTISDVVPGAADLFVIGRDLENFVTDIPEEQKVILVNIVDKDELKTKLQEKFDAE